MNELEELGRHVIFGNDVAAWTKALLQFALWFTVLPIVKRFVTRRLQKLAPEQSSAPLELVLDLLRRTTRLFLVVVAVYLAAQWLEIPPTFGKWITGTVLLIVWLQVALWGSAAVRFFVDRRLTRDPEAAKESAASMNILKFVGIAAVWVLAGLLLLANLGIDVTALIAGLGVGGIAIALAVQKVLGDLLASLSIALDKPFKVGDFLVIGEEKGTVEHIGIKSTRLRSISGEQVVVSNADLLSSRVHNFGLLYERRAVFRVGVTYETPQDKVAEVPGILEEAIRAQPKTRFDRAHFASFGAYSLDFEAVYFVLDPGYGTFMDIQQAINLRLLDVFRERGIDFAYPTAVEYQKELPGRPAT
ncbi:MAG: mechanosensitive ion channel family protein [Steroidobacteraceae bacterium]|jgi:small-conductance mechanosensitive channel|nr:mechanosensitive ion channel family protein [Steroidobacteraceae bacterium]